MKSLNEYLGELCKHYAKLKKEFLEFLEFDSSSIKEMLKIKTDLIESYQDLQEFVIPDIDSSYFTNNCKGADSDIEITSNNIGNIKEILQKIWSCESYYKISLHKKLTHDSKLNYLITITCKDKHFQAEKPYHEILGFNNALTQALKHIKLPPFPFRTLTTHTINNTQYTLNNTTNTTNTTNTNKYKQIQHTPLYIYHANYTENTRLFINRVC